MKIKDKELSVVLRELARGQKVGLCNEWYSEWEDDTPIDTLLDKYVNGLDFCIENDYPSLDFIREHFDMEDLHRHHIYLDEDVDISDAGHGTWIFLGHCTGSISFKHFAAASVYVRHTSVLDVHSTDYTVVYVSAYEEGWGMFDSGGGVMKVYDRRKKKEA